MSRDQGHSGHKGGLGDLIKLSSGIFLRRSAKEEIDSQLEKIKVEKARQEIVERMRERERGYRVTKDRDVSRLSVQARHERRQRNKMRAKVRNTRNHREHGRQVR